MQSLYDWIQLQRKTLSKHAEMGKAFDYILNHWNALNEFCRDGQVEIDNNIGENALRSVAVGRKNYLFFGSDKGGESAAIIYSLLVAKWHLNRSQFGITIDHDLACFRSLIGILPVTPGINSFHHSLHCRV